MAKDNKFSQLMKAIKNRNSDKAKELIKDLTPEQLSETDFFGITPLYKAAYYALDVFQLLIDKATDETINGSNDSETPLYQLIASNENSTEVIEISEILLKKMSKDAINKKIGYFEVTVLHEAAYYKKNPELCKLILKANPDIINIQNKDNETALDLIGKDIYYTCFKTLFHTKGLNEIKLEEGASKLVTHGELNAEIEGIKVIKLLCEHGGIFNQEVKIKEIFKDLIEPIKMIDKIFNLEKLKTKLEIPAELHEMLINRFQFKLLQKFSLPLKSEDFIQYTSHLNSISKQLPEELYSGLKVLLNKAEAANDQLGINEARLISIFESEENDMSMVPFKLLKDNYGKFNMSNLLSDTPEQRTLDFYGANLKYTKKIGTYLLELLNDPQRLSEKLETHPEGWVILKNINEKLLLSESLKSKLEKFLESYVFEESPETKTLMPDEQTISESTEKIDFATDEQYVLNHVSELIEAQITDIPIIEVEDYHIT